MRSAGRNMMEAKLPVRLAVLVSGNGSNLQSIIDCIESEELNANIAVVISNNHEAYALTRATNHGIAVVVHEHLGYTNRREYDAAMVDILQKHRVDLVILAGFMRILSEVMIGAFPNTIMNIHPALLPAFPGLHAQQQALTYGVRFSGCTVHFVDCGTDTGPIILQSIVPVHQDDTEETLSARIQTAEHSAYPDAIRLFSEGKIMVQGRHVLLLP